MSGRWRNRIVRKEETSPAALIANPRNWRTHPKFQQDALADILDKIGWVQDIIVNERTGHIVDGHLRVELAIGRNEASIPVNYVDLDEEEERLILATFDPITYLANRDSATLKELLKTINEQGAPTLDRLLEQLRGVNKDAVNTLRDRFIVPPLLHPRQPSGLLEQTKRRLAVPRLRQEHGEERGSDRLELLPGQHAEPHVHR